MVGAAVTGEFNAERLESLLESMARPTFVWRRAMGLVSETTMTHNPGRQLGAVKRRMNALAEIDGMIRRYVDADAHGNRAVD